MNKKSFPDYFPNERKRIFTIASAFIFLGYLIDFIFNANKFGTILWIADFSEMVIILFSTTFALLGYISIQTSYAITLYSSIVLLTSSYFYFIYNGTFEPSVIFQDMLVIPLITISAGLILSRKHLLTIGLLYFITYPLIMWFSEDPTLRDSVLFVAILTIGSTLILYYIFGLIEQSLAEKEEGQKQLEREKDKTKKANEEKDKLFSVIAHDLRGPIGNVRNMLSYISDYPLDELEKKEIIDGVLRSVEKTYNLLVSLLDWSTNEQGYLNYSPKNINLKSVAEDALDFVAEEVKSKKIEIINNIDEDIVTYSDSNMLMGIFRNLLSNAIKFSHVAGRIHLDAEIKREEIVVIVKDEGVGISQEKLNKIFSETNIETSLGTKSEIGYGFGMNLIKDFVQKNGGKIWAESEEGKGTTFYFTVPLQSFE